VGRDSRPQGPHTPGRSRGGSRPGPRRGRRHPGRARPVPAVPLRGRRTQRHALCARGRGPPPSCPAGTRRPVRQPHRVGPAGARPGILPLLPAAATAAGGRPGREAARSQQCAGA